MELVEHIGSKNEFLKVDDFYLHGFLGCHVTHFESKDVFAVCIYLTVSRFFTFLYSLIVFYSGLFLFFHNSLHSLVAENSHEAVNTSVGADGETIL